MKLSESEWQIMNALWQRYPASARDVLERLPENINWAYTTVKTMLNRLVDKNAISERKRANTSLYEPLLTKHKARHSAFANLLNNAFEGTVGPLVHFLVEEKKLSPAERKELITLLQKEDQHKDKKND